MPSLEENIFHSRFRLLSEISSVLVIIFGSIVLMGWLWDIQILRSFGAHLVSMKVNTAISIILTGLTLWFLQEKRAKGAYLLFARIFASIIILISLLTLLQYVFNLDFGIDQFLFKEAAGSIGTSNPGRQSPNTCVNFILIGLSLLLLDVQTKRGVRPAQFIILLEGLLSLLAFVGYIYGVRRLLGAASHTLMSLPTSITLITIFFGIIFARPGRGIISIFTADNAGGILARRLTFVVVAIPLAGEILVELGVKSGLYSEVFKPALHTIIIIISFLSIVWAIANLLGQIDEKRKAIEQKIRESEEKYRDLVEDANSIIMRMDTKGAVTFFNNFAERFFGYPEQEIFGKSVIGTIVPSTDHSGADLKAMVEDICVNPTKYVNNENENILRSGKHVWIAWTNRAIFDKDKRLKEILCVGNDITKLKEAEAHILVAKDAAERANKAKSAFLANMSHELRTPLNAVIGFAELLKEQGFGALNDTQKEYVGYIWESGKHLLSLINDVLDLSKVEAGKMELVISEVNLSDLLRGSFIFIAEQAAKHKIGLSTNIAPDINTIKADERKIKQVIFNLLSNSVKFTPDGGKICIDAKKTGENEVLICVWDTGIGIEKKDMERVFSEFEQIDSEYSRKYAGTGLGMPLSKKIVELHGGKMWFESEGKDKGTRFYFSLPISQPKV